MTLTTSQALIIMAMVTLGTIISRFLPFILFKHADTENAYIKYLGQVLPLSAIGLLVVYCLKDVSFTSSPRGIPEAISLIIIALLHYSKENTLLSIGVGTLTYMALVQFVFI